MDIINLYKMRTSQSQFEVMVDFMERNGDLNKPVGTTRKRIENILKWEELTGVLNLDVTGTSRSMEKWKKVWSDFKNNIKKKAVKIHRASIGNGPETRMLLNELDQRVLEIMGLKPSLPATKLKEVKLAAADPLAYLEEDEKPELLDVASSPADSDSHHSEAHSDDYDDNGADTILENGTQSPPLPQMETPIEEVELEEEIMELPRELPKELPTTNQRRANITIKPQGHVLKLVRLVPIANKIKTNHIKIQSNISKTERELPTAHHSHTNITNKTNTNLTNKIDTNLTNKTDTNLLNRTMNISKINRKSNYDSNRFSKSRNRTITASEQFLNADTHWRNLAKEFATENANLRKRELELRERELQQQAEWKRQLLQQQAEWQRLFGRCLDIVERYVS